MSRCCSVLQCAAVGSVVLQCAAVCCSGFSCLAVCCGGFSCLAVWKGVARRYALIQEDRLQCVAVPGSEL